MLENYKISNKKIKMYFDDGHKEVVSYNMKEVDNLEKLELEALKDLVSKYDDNIDDLLKDHSNLFKLKNKFKFYVPFILVFLFPRVSLGLYALMIGGFISTCGILDIKYRNFTKNINDYHKYKFYLKHYNVFYNEFCERQVRKFQNQEEIYYINDIVKSIEPITPLNIDNVSLDDLGKIFKENEDLEQEELRMKKEQAKDENYGKVDVREIRSLLEKDIDKPKVLIKKR